MTRYVALQPIDHGGVRAYNAGDPVHPDNVQANGYVLGEQVADADSDQAQARLRELGILPPADEPDDVPEDADGAGAGPAGFDPAEHTIAEVNAWLDEHPDDTARVLRAETEGKMRAGVMHGPHGTPPDVAEG